MYEGKNMTASRNESKSILTEKELELREKIELSEKIAFEKCRLFRDRNAWLPSNFPNYDVFVWSRNECENASKNVVKQIEELSKYKYGSNTNIR